KTARKHDARYPCILRGCNIRPGMVKFTFCLNSRLRQCHMPIQTDRTREGSNTHPIVAITMGDPCGVGPEIIVKAFDSPGFPGECVPLVIADSLPLERAIKLLGSSAVIRPMTGQMLRSFR